MRRATLAVTAALFLTLAAPCTWAQHEAAAEHGEKGAHEEKHEGEGLEVWAWANFLVLAAGLAYAFRKNAVPFFVQRAIGIRKSMVEADEARADAERRIAAVEAKLGKLGDDIQALKDEALAEGKAEYERVRRETAAELARMRTNAEQEIVSAGKSARAELKRYSAALAIGVAAEKVRARMNPDTQDSLVRGFVSKLTGVSS